MLVGPIGPKLKDLLDKRIKIPNEVFIDKDEVHLILEYKINQEWANLKSPHSNRFIVSHDIYNSKMEMLDVFFNLSRHYEPDIIILSGLHLLESQNEDLRIEKLKNLKTNLNQYDKKGFIHLELASIGDHNLMKNIIEHVSLNLVYLNKSLNKF
jgi:ADP-dependent glucokinase